MLDWINNIALSLADPLLCWLLRLPSDVALIIVAVGTGAIITFSRVFTTNQDLLRRCHQDKKRLKELIRLAKRERDKKALGRYRDTWNMIGLTTMKQEGRPLLAALVPIAILGTWCFQRLAFIPPRDGETLVVKATFPVSSIGELVHLVPQNGLTEVSGGADSDRGQWIQEIVSDDPGAEGTVSRGVAIWRLQAQARPEPYVLEIRAKTTTAVKQLLVGQTVYSTDTELYGDAWPITSVEIGMRHAPALWLADLETAAQDHLRNVVQPSLLPWIPFGGLPSWLVAYFLIAVPSVSLIKRITGIY